MHIPSLAADIGFVNFDFARKLLKGSGLHRLADSMIHKPSGFLSDAKMLSEFIRANAVLHVYDHPDGRKPLVQAYRRILEYGSRLGAKLFPARLAFPDATGRDEAMFGRIAPRASNAFGPMNLNHKVQRVIAVGEILNRGQQSLWKGFVLHSERTIARIAV